MRRLKDLFAVDGKTALVCGGAGHLGTAMCEALAELGANLVIASRNKDRCERLAERLSQEFTNCKADGVALDITNQESIRSTLAFVQHNYGRLDILINSAAAGKKNTFESITVEDWQFDVDVCLNAVFYTVKLAFPLLKASKGVILNIASMYGHLSPDYRIYFGTPYANPPSYGAAKAGVIQLTKYLASFLSLHGIRVNAVSPGAFPYGDTLKSTEFIDRLKSKAILNDIGQPEQLKGVVAFLCSDASSFVTGQNICVDGGWGVW